MIDVIPGLPRPGPGHPRGLRHTTTRAAQVAPGTPSAALATPQTAPGTPSAAPRLPRAPSPRARLPAPRLPAPRLPGHCLRRHCLRGRCLRGARQAVRYAIARLASTWSPGPAASPPPCARAMLPPPYNTRPVILDIGYSDQVPGAIRRAVALRARHCEWPGCHKRPRPPADVHHLRHKRDGGETSVRNCAHAVPVHHHDVCIHRWGWRLTLHPDGTTTAHDPPRPGYPQPRATLRQQPRPQPRATRHRSNLDTPGAAGRFPAGLTSTCGDWRANRVRDANRPASRRGVKGGRPVRQAGQLDQRDP